MFRLLAPWLLAALAAAGQCSLTLNANLPTGVTGLNYPGVVTHGGSGPWSYQVTAGSLPPGLSVIGNGGAAIFTGTPSAAGSYDFTLQVTDASSCVGVSVLRIVIGGQVAVTPAAFPGGTVGRLYSQPVGLSAGTVPLPLSAVSLNSGALPPGLAITGGGGGFAITGTPTQVGTYSFELFAAGSTGFAATRAYSLTISGNSTAVATPGSLRVTTRLGDPPPPAQQLLISASDGGAYRYAVTAVSPGFRLENASGEFVTPFPLQPRVQPLSNLPGFYTGYIQLTPLDGEAPVVRVTVELVVEPPPTLIVDTAALAVSMRQNDPPVTRNIQVASSDQTLQYTIETLTPIGGNWLALTPAFGPTPANVNVVFNPAGLPEGNYAGTIRISASRNGHPAIGSPKVIPVAFVINPPNAPTGFSASPSALVFNGRVAGALPAAQLLRIDNTGASVSWLAQANVPWLNLSQITGATPSDVVVNVYPDGLAAGTHQGQLTFSSGGASVVVPVTLNLDPAQTNTGDPVLRVNPENVSAIVSTASPFASWNIQVDGVNQNLDVEFTPTVPWLRANPTAARTPTGATILADASGLAPGEHKGAVVAVTTNPINNLRTSYPVNVTLFVTDSATPGLPGSVIPSRSSLFFDWRQGAGVPPSQTVILSSSGLPVDWDASATVTWINLGKRAGRTPEDLEISVSPQFLGAGNYRGEIRFRRGTEEVGIITVFLSIAGPGALRADPAALVYLVETGRDAAPQLFDLSRPDSLFPAEYTIRSMPEWLSVTPDKGATPARLEATLRRDRLPQATTTVLRLEGEIAIESAAGGVRIPVLLTVVPPQGSPAGREAPWILSVTNDASTLPGPVAPGQHATLYGGFEGQDVRVWFDANRAPLLAQQPNQLTVAVPFAVAGRASAKVRVEVDTLSSRDLEVRVADTAPGIYTVNGSGRGFAVGFNEDGAPNADNPAPAGTLVTIALTGLGQTDPPGSDGNRPEPGQGPRPLAPVEIKVAGVVADLIACFSPDGQAEGAIQCQFRLPSIEPGDHPLLVTAGGVASQPGVRIRVGARIE